MPVGLFAENDAAASFFAFRGTLFRDFFLSKFCQGGFAYLCNSGIILASEMKIKVRFTHVYFALRSVCIIF